MNETETYSAFRVPDTCVSHDRGKGLHLESVDNCTQIHVQTRNRVHEITAIDGY